MIPIGFTSPLILLALLALPVLWYLLRLVPPKPRLIRFPPTKLLLKIEPKEETPSRTPWWLTALRLLLAALVILAAAGPLLNPPPATSRTSGPIVLVVDSGWASAAQWQNRLYTAHAILARADASVRGSICICANDLHDQCAGIVLRTGERKRALRAARDCRQLPIRNNFVQCIDERFAIAEIDAVRQPDHGSVRLAFHEIA